MFYSGFFGLTTQISPSYAQFSFPETATGCAYICSHVIPRYASKMRYNSVEIRHFCAKKRIGNKIDRDL